MKVSNVTHNETHDTKPNQRSLNMATKAQKASYAVWVKSQPGGTTSVTLEQWLAGQTATVNPEPQPSAETLAAAQAALTQGTQPEATDKEDDSGSGKKGPWQTEAEAKANPVKGVKTGKTLDLYLVTVPGGYSRYWYGMNYHHAAIQALKDAGGTVSMCGSGRGSAVAAANGRATEAEMRAAAALADKLAAEKAAQQVQDSMVSQMVLLIRSMPEATRQAAIDGIADATIKDRVTAGLAS